MVEEKTSQNTEELLDESDKIQGLGYSSFTHALMFSAFLGMWTYNIYSIAEVDAWISTIIGAIFGIIPLILILYIIKHSKGENILDLNLNIFGKVIGTILNVLLNIFILFFSALIFYNLTLFLNTQYIPDTSNLYIKIVLIIPVIYAASKSIPVISRVSQIVLIANIILFLLSIIGITENMSVDNLLPILSNGLYKPLLGSIQYVIFGVLPLFSLTIIPTKLIPNKDKIAKHVSIMYIIINIIKISIFTIYISILGYEIISIYKYPEYMVLTNFTLFEIIERVENTLAIQNVFSMFMLIALSAYFINISIKKVFKKVKSQQLFPYLIGTLLVVLSTIMFRDSDMATKFIVNYAPYIIGIGFSFFIVITFIGIVVKEKIEKNKQNSIALEE